MEDELVIFKDLPDKSTPYNAYNMNHNFDVFNKQIKAEASKIDTTLQEIQTFQEQTEETLTTQIDNFTNDIENKATTLQQNITQAREDLQSEIQSSNTDLTKQITDSNTELTKQIETSNQELTKQITDSKTSLEETIDQTREDLYTEIGKQIASISSLSILMVDTLPEEHINETTMYLIKPENLPSTVDAKSSLVANAKTVQSTPTVKPQVFSANGVELYKEMFDEKSSLLDAKANVQASASNGIGIPDDEYYICCFWVRTDIEGLTHKWVAVGTTKIDLSQYSTTEEMKKAIQDSVEVLKVQINEDIQPKLDDLVKKMPSKITDLTNDILVRCDSENDAKEKSQTDTKHIYYVPEQQPVPLVSVDEVILIPNGDTGNKTIAEIEEVEYSNNKLVGTLKYVQGYEINGQTLGGHILVLHIDKTKLPSGNIRVSLDSATTLDENDNVYLRVTNQNKTDYVKVSVNSRTLYALDISSLTLEEETLTINVPAEPVLGKEITELQNDISIVEDKVTGSLNYVYGFDMFSAGFEGYFLALEIPEAKGGCEVTFELSNADYKAKGKLDLDGILVIKLRSKNQKLTLKNGSITRVLDLTGLTFKTKIVDFATGTIGELEAMLNAHYDGSLNISDHWSVGDKRTLHLNEITDTEGGEVYAEQDMEFTIIGIEHDDLVTPINEKTKSAITLQCTKVLGANSSENGYVWGKLTNSINTDNYNNNPRRTWLNNTFLYALPSGILVMVKEVNKKNLANHTNATAGTTTKDKVFLLSMSEVGLTSANYKGTEELEGAKYSYFDTSENLKKTYNNSEEVAKWWLKSPLTTTTDGQGYNWGAVDTEGAGAEESGNATNGIAPTFCL